MKNQIDICAMCFHDHPGYSSVIGTIPHCCERHWHCRPGAEAKDFKKKPQGVTNGNQIDKAD